MSYIIYHPGTGTYMEYSECQLIEVPTGWTDEMLDDALSSGSHTEEGGEQLYKQLGVFELSQIEDPENITFAKRPDIKIIYAVRSEEG